MATRRGSDVSQGKKAKIEDGRDGFRPLARRPRAAGFLLRSFSFASQKIQGTDFTNVNEAAGSSRAGSGPDGRCTYDKSGRTNSNGDVTTSNSEDKHSIYIIFDSLTGGCINQKDYKKKKYST